MPITITEITSKIEECRNKLRNYQGGSEGKKRIKIALAKKLEMLLTSYFKKVQHKEDFEQAIRYSHELIGLEKSLGFIENQADSQHRLATYCLHLGELYEERNPKQAMYWLDQAQQAITLAEQLAPNNPSHKKFAITIIKHYIYFCADYNNKLNNADFETRIIYKLKTFELHKLLIKYQKEEITKAAHAAYHLACSYNEEVSNIINSNKADDTHLHKMIDNSFFYITEAIHLVDSKEYIKRAHDFVFYYRQFLFDILSKKSSLTTQKEIYLLLIEMANFAPEHLDKIDLISDLAYIYFQQREHNSAFKAICQIKDSLATIKHLKRHIIITEAYAKTIAEKEPEQAEKIYLENITLNQGHDEKVLAFCYSGLASIYFKTYLPRISHNTNDYIHYLRLAIDYYERALKIPTDYQNSYAHMLITAHMQHGLYYENAIKHHKKGIHLFSAFNCYQTAIEIANQFNQLRKLGRAYNCLAEFCYYNQYPITQVIDYYKLSIINSLEGMSQEGIITYSKRNIFNTELDNILNNKDINKVIELRKLKKDILTLGTNTNPKNEYSTSRTKHGSFIFFKKGPKEAAPRTYQRNQHTTPRSYPY